MDRESIPRWLHRSFSIVLQRFTERRRWSVLFPLSFALQWTRGRRRCAAGNSTPPTDMPSPSATIRERWAERERTDETIFFSPELSASDRRDLFRFFIFGQSFPQVFSVPRIVKQGVKQLAMIYGNCAGRKSIILRFVLSLLLFVASESR